MARAGHRTARAALIYQHAAEERNALLAMAMDAVVPMPAVPRHRGYAKSDGAGAEVSAMPVR